MDRRQTHRLTDRHTHSKSRPTLLSFQTWPPSTSLGSFCPRSSAACLRPLPRHRMGCLPSLSRDFSLSFFFSSLLLVQPSPHLTSPSLAPTRPSSLAFPLLPSFLLHHLLPAQFFFFFFSSSLLIPSSLSTFCLGHAIDGQAPLQAIPHLVQAQP